MRLLLIRHGQASFGAGDYDRLSAVGERQARLLGQRFAATGFRPQHLLSGELKRQRATLAGLRAEVPGSTLAWPEPAHTPALNEYDHEALLRAYLPRVIAELGVGGAAVLFAEPRLFQKAFVRVMRHWQSASPADSELPESWRQFQDRVLAGLHSLAESAEGESVLAISSGGPIACALQYALGLDDEAMLNLNWSIANASLSELHYRGGIWRLQRFNDIAHLEFAGEAGLITYR